MIAAAVDPVGLVALIILGAAAYWWTRSMDKS
jgi:hypothetical protein